MKSSMHFSLINLTSFEIHTIFLFTIIEKFTQKINVHLRNTPKSTITLLMDKQTKFQLCIHFLYVNGHCFYNVAATSLKHFLF